MRSCVRMRVPDVSEKRLSERVTFAGAFCRDLFGRRRDLLKRIQTVQSTARSSGLPCDAAALHPRKEENR